MRDLGDMGSVERWVLRPIYCFVWASAVPERASWIFRHDMCYASAITALAAGFQSSIYEGTILWSRFSSTLCVVDLVYRIAQIQRDEV